MSEWITDRLPTAADADSHRFLWITVNGKVFIRSYEIVDQGTPWMPITKPEPYVEPKPKHSVRIDICHPDKWVVYDGIRYVADNIPTQEAAERMAAIYNEVMP